MPVENEPSSHTANEVETAVRALTPTDLTSLVDLFVALQDDPDSGRFRPAREEGRVAAQSLTQELDSDNVLHLGFFVEGKLAGLASIREHDHEPNLDLVVHPALRGCGVGGFLLSNVLERASERGTKKISVSVHSDDEAAVGIGRKFGVRFLPRGEYWLVGDLDPSRSAPHLRPLDSSRIEEWIESRKRPFRLGIWCAFGTTLRPQHGIGIFTYHLIESLLRTRPDVNLSVAVHPGDEDALAEYVAQYPGRIEVLSPRSAPVPVHLPVAEPLPKRWVRRARKVKSTIGTPVRWAKQKRHHTLSYGNRLAKSILKSVIRDKDLAAVPMLILLPVLAVMLWTLFAVGKLGRAAIDIVMFPFRQLRAVLVRPQAHPVEALPVHVVPAIEQERFPRGGALSRYPISETAAANCDVWVYPFSGLPVNIGHHASVVFIHDLVFSRFPEQFDIRWVVEIEQLVTDRVREATLLACMSDFIRRNDLLGLLSLAEERVRMVPPAVPTDCLNVVEPASDSPLRVHFDQPYFIYTSALRGYKNHQLLIEGLAVLDRRGHRDFHLVFTVSESSMWLKKLEKRIGTLGLQDRVHLIGLVDRGELNWLYRNAIGTLIPSLYEQGSFPLYESIALGCPAACSDIPALREQCQGFNDAVPFFDPYDPEAVAEVMLDLHRSRDVYIEKQSAAARANWTRTWDGVSERWLAIFRQAAHLYRHALPPARNRSTRGTFRIGCWLDYAGITLKPTEGIGVFIHSWLDGLLSLPENLEVVLMTNRADSEVVDPLVRKFPNRVRVLPGPEHRLADSVQVARRENCHVWVLPYTALPLKLEFPNVVMLHDFVLRHHPQGFDPQTIAYTENCFRQTISQASRVVCESDLIAEMDGRGIFDISPEKLRVIYAAAPNPNLAEEKGEPSAVLKRLVRPFIFYPGALRGYKNHASLLHAFRLLREEYGEDGFDLVFTGPNVSTWPEELRLVLDHGRFGGRIHLLGKVDVATIHELYRRAFALVFPSLYEGCGLPVFEAINHGCPVACSDIPIFHEQFGCMEDSLVFFNPEQPHSIARAILRMRDHRESILAEQQRLAKVLLRRNWKDVAAEWLTLLREVAFGVERSQARRAA